MGNVYMEASQINYRGGEKKMSVEAALKNTSGEAAAIAQLQADVSNLSDIKANQITIAPTFSAETSYVPGDIVYYNGLSYRCVNAHEGEWDADDFAATTISNELASLMSGLIGLTEIDVIPLKDDFYAEADRKARYVKLNVGNNGLYVITGDFKNNNALTANTAYTIAEMPDNALVDSFGAEFNNAGKITIARNSNALVFTPAANAAAYSTFRITIMFIV